MDARDRLRLYLEQRRELGESDLTLDQLPVQDVMSILGVQVGTGDRPAPRKRVVEQAVERVVEQADAGTSAPPPAAPTPPPPVEVQTPAPPAPPAPRGSASPASASGDWRQLLGAAQEKPEPTAPPVTAASTAVPAWLSALDIPMGITVDSSLAIVSEGNRPADDTLDAVATAIAGCTACALHASATQSVPGEGNPLADFVCVGEAPGQTEDETGRPFVGAAGQLLTKILSAIELSRDDVFICNVLKHRPPGNRNPNPDEVLACRPFLERQLALLRPRVILAMGTFAAQTLLETRESLGALRGRIHRYQGIPLVVTYHPAALLRNVAWKRPTWDDVQLARRVHDASHLANPS